MIEFKILKQCKKSRARRGILKTPHGEIETPTLVPVATQAVIKTLSSEEVGETGTQVIIANTFHLHVKSGEKIIKSAGGIHKFMNWQKPIMTDSGGFQVFSLGFGRDQGVGKILKYFSNYRGRTSLVKEGQPKEIKILNEGVQFRSPINGKEIFLGPKESIKIQEAIGADIMFAFDECTSPLATKEYVKNSLKRTHQWAKECIGAKKTERSLFGIIQGSHFKDFREESARFINSLEFDGFGIGGDLGASKKDMIKIIGWVIDCLDERKPRHLLGIGHPEDIEPIIKSGVDTFDCIAPTHYARRGIAFTNSGRLNLAQSKFLKDKKPVDKNCGCFVCRGYSRSYLCHLFRAKEITAMNLLTFHNLHFFNSYVKKIREDI